MMNFENPYAGKKTQQVAYFKPYKGHIRNPGMGIVSMAVSDHMATGYNSHERKKKNLEEPFALTEKMLEEVTALPYIDNLYIRVGWDDVQIEKGKLSISPAFEMAVEAAGKAGISWGLRIMQTSPSNPKEHLIPDFLTGKLPLYPYYDTAYFGTQPRKLPLYTEDYLKYWEEMLLMVGEKYDGDDALEYADMSGYGLWGEGHHGCCAKKDGPVVDLELDTRERSEEVVERLICSHQKAFERTPMVMNLVLGEYEAAQRAIQEGCWVRRDSYYHWFTAEQAQYGLMRKPEAAMIFETVMPGIPVKDNEDAAFRRNYMELPDKMCDYGASYGIVGFNPLDTLYADHMMPELFDAFKNRLGYRLRPSICWKMEKENGKNSLVLGMVNDGVANPPGKVLIQAECNGEITGIEVNGGDLGSRMYLVEIPLPIHAADKVELSMFLLFAGKKKPIRFAVDVCSRQAPFRITIQLNH